MVEAAEAETNEKPRSFSNRPVILADNKHGTKVKLWTNKGKNGEFHTVSIERSYREKEGEDYKTQQVTLNADDLLAVAHALQQGHSNIAEKQLGQQFGKQRGE